MSSQNSGLSLIDIILIILILFVFVFTLGKVEIPIEKNEQNADDDNDNLNKLKDRYRKLKALIKRKKLLHIKLNKRFKVIYFGVRVVLITLYLGFNAILFFVLDIKDLGEILNWNQVAVLIMIIFSFITFGTFSNVKEFVYSIKMQLEIRTFKKYLNIDEQVNTLENEASKLSIEIKSSETKNLSVNNQMASEYIQSNEDSENQK